VSKARSCNCASCGPYVTLARNAVPGGQPASSILDLTIGQWETKVGLPPLPSAPNRPGVGGIGVSKGEA
jgi:histidine decarboxylase